MRIGSWELKKIEKIPLPRVTANVPSGIANTLPPVAAGKMLNDPGTVTWQAGNRELMVKDGYSGNDIVYSIIRLITEKVKQAPWAEYTVKDEKQYKKYLSLTKNKDFLQDIKAVTDLQSKALELAKVKTKLSDLINYPNEQDAWQDLVEAYASFKLITGNAYIFGKQILAGKNMGMPNELYALPSQYMSIYADLNVFPVVPKSYMLYMQYMEQFTKQEILHDKYFNPNWNIVGNQLYGLSPLEAAAKVLTRSNEGKQAAVSNYQNGGPKGILFVSDDRHDPQETLQEAMDLKKTLARNQGSKNVNQVETSGYKVDYVPLGLSPVDLDLLNAEGMDTQALCNVYGVPAALMGVKGGMTYNGMPEAEKALTARCAIPMLSSIRDQFNRKFQTDWGFKNTGRVIDYDASVYLELQEDKGKQVTWLKDAPLHLRRKLEIMGESADGYTEEQLASIIIGAGSTTLDDVLMGSQQAITPPAGLEDYGNQ
jgi:HK97 family phage portal protein